MAKLAGPHIPASMKQLMKAIDAAHTALQKAEHAARTGDARAGADDGPAARSELDHPAGEEVGA